jgi:DNA invertase Pin-like site-specific DNA recombinase
VIYARTSVDHNEGRSVDAQLAELRRWAHSTGRRVIAELRDDGISASRYAKIKIRPGWTQAMELIAAGDVDELAVWELSRSTRDRAVWAALLAALIEHDVALVVDGKVHDPNDPDDGFMLDLGAALAVRESGVIRKRNQRGVDARAAAGRPHGSVPFGYRRVFDPVTGKAVAREPHPEQAPIVQEIARRLLKRESADSIAADLNRRGVPTGTGKQWRGGNLTKLIRRPTYAAMRVYRGEVLADVSATWPALISRDDHAALETMFADPERDKYRNSTVTKHLGTGLFKCGRKGCDGVMRVVVQGADRPNRYDCRVCHRVSRNQEPVDDLVNRLVAARLSKPDVIEALSDQGEDEDVKAATAEVRRLKMQLADARDKVASGELTLDDLAFFRKRWERELEEAERRARPKWLPDAVYEIAGPDAKARWGRALISTKRVILGALFEVTILPAGPGNWKFDPDLVQVEWKSSLRRTES